MLMPLAAEGSGQASDTPAAPGVSPGVGVNAPARVDPLLPGVSHPALRGVPGLDTIQEAVAIPGAQAGTPKAPASTASTPHGPTSTPAFASATAGGQGDTGSSPPGEAEGPTDPSSRRTSYAAALMSDSVGSDMADLGNGTYVGAGEGGKLEQGEDTGIGDGAVGHPGGGAKGEGGGDPYAMEAEEAQYGSHKIPGNPPFESDDDEDELENDISHPEGFLRAMPEDESSMRVLKLPDGRVRRVEDDEDDDVDDVSDEERSADGAEPVAPVQTAPSSAQAPPLASGGSVQTAADVVASAGVATTAAAASTAVAVAAATAAAPVPAPPPAGPAPPAPSPAERYPPAVPAPTAQAPRPPVTDPTVFSSAGRRRVSVPVDVERTLTSMAESSSAGTVFARAASGGMDPATSSTAAGLASDPGSATIGPAVPLQRARSFSPLEHTQDGLYGGSPPPMAPVTSCPAPSFPAPHPPTAGGYFGEQLGKNDGIQQTDGLGTGNGPGVALTAASEGESLGQGLGQSLDKELQELLSGRVGRCQTEIKVANLQGPEQEIMRLVMHTRMEGRLQEVEFDFNLDHDSPKQVRGVAWCSVQCAVCFLVCWMQASFF